MNILIVDDELGKAQEISRVFLDAEVSADIVHESTAVSARKRMRAQDFDIIIIDLNLPDGFNDKASDEGGIALLDLLLLDEHIRLPKDVFFITGKEELVKEARLKASERGAVLWQYESQSTTWKSMLLGRAKYILNRRARTADCIKVDVAIITALHTPELDAVLALDYGWRSKRFAGDPTTYHFGSLNRGGEIISFVAVCASRKGMPSAAALSAKVTALFSPQYLMMLGICAGIPGKVNLGDVVVADPTWDYGSGKRALDNNRSPVFYAAAYQVALDPHLRQLVAELARDQQVIRELRGNWGGDTPKGSLSAHVGPMASGASVISDDVESRNIVLQHREVVAIEMEAYAVMAAVEYSISPKPKAIAIKSVCDYADEHKNDDWQKYAAYTSAAFADKLFRHLDFCVQRP
jgi:nucleoside phosphorylase